MFLIFRIFVAAAVLIALCKDSYVVYTRGFDRVGK